MTGGAWLYVWSTYEVGYIQSFQFAILNLLSHVQCIKKRQMLKNIYLTVRYIEYAQRRSMKMMMVASLVVRSGCDTPHWLRGGKGGGVVVGGLVVVGGVMDNGH